MIPLREVLVRPGIIDSERVCRLPLACQIFFRNLLHAADGAGIFPADADELKQAFYWRCPGVTRPHIEAWLAQCHRAGLVNLYTNGGKGWGEVINYGQRDHRRKRLYPTRSEDELNFTAPPGADPPPKRKPTHADDQNKNRMEGKGKRAERATPAPERVEESHEEWLARLAKMFPQLSIELELRSWMTYCQKHQKRPQRPHFERWLEGSGPTVDLAAAGAKAAPIEPEPEAWKAYLKDRYEGEDWAQTAAIYHWPELPAHWRAKIAREMARAS